MVWRARKTTKKWKCLGKNYYIKFRILSHLCRCCLAPIAIYHFIVFYCFGVRLGAVTACHFIITSIKIPEIFCWFVRFVGTVVASIWCQLPGKRLFGFAPCVIGLSRTTRPSQSANNSREGRMNVSCDGSTQGSKEKKLFMKSEICVWVVFTTYNTCDIIKSIRTFILNNKCRSISLSPPSFLHSFRLFFSRLPALFYTIQLMVAEVYRCELTREKIITRNMLADQVEKGNFSFYIANKIRYMAGEFFFLRLCFGVRCFDLLVSSGSSGCWFQLRLWQWEWIEYSETGTDCSGYSCRIKRSIELLIFGCQHFCWQEKWVSCFKAPEKHKNNSAQRKRKCVDWQFACQVSIRSASMCMCICENWFWREHIMKLNN